MEKVADFSELCFYRPYHEGGAGRNRSAIAIARESTAKSKGPCFHFLRSFPNTSPLNQRAFLFPPRFPRLIPRLMLSPHIVS